jgi:hypothetical protein
VKTQLPKPLENLLHDLRERRLLPLVAVLVVAIIAVPLLFGKDGGPEPTPSSSALSSADAAADIEGAEIVRPVVLAEVPGIRDFRERLQDFRRRNPFKQQLTGVPKKVRDAQNEAIDDVIADVGGDGGGAPDPGVGDSGAAPDSPSSNDPGTTTTETRDYALLWTIDAKVGKVGEGKKKKGIKEFTYLPGDSHPVVQFITGVGDHTAFFVVSRSVGKTQGDGNCRPRGNDCQFLALKVGDSRTFEYEPNGERYRIKLSKVEMKKKRVDSDDPDSFSKFNGLG